MTVQNAGTKTYPGAKVGPYLGPGLGVGLGILGDLGLLELIYNDTKMLRTFRIRISIRILVRRLERGSVLAGVQILVSGLVRTMEILVKVRRKSNSYFYMENT